MKMRSSVLRSAFAAGLVAVAVAGCGSMRPSQKVDIYEATMTGAEEVPPVSTGARGTAEVQVDTSTNMLSWKVNYSGLSGPATGAHIHGPAGPGQNAPVVIPFTNVTSQPIEGRMSVTPQQIADLAAGRMYANVHTAAHPGGEIRGQLRRRQ